MVVSLNSILDFTVCFVAFCTNIVYKSLMTIKMQFISLGREGHHANQYHCQYYYQYQYHGIIIIIIIITMTTINPSTIPQLLQICHLVRPIFNRPSSNQASLPPCKYILESGRVGSSSEAYAKYRPSIASMVQTKVRRSGYGRLRTCINTGIRWS